jgi:hypothetical protein
MRERTHTPGVELEDSHFLSAGIYRILRDDTEKNPNPWLLTKNATVQTSRQLKAHLLCRSCEERFTKNGENWVLRHCRQKDGRSPKPPGLDRALTFCWRTLIVPESRAILK